MLAGRAGWHFPPAIVMTTLEMAFSLRLGRSYRPRKRSRWIMLLPWKPWFSREDIIGTIYGVFNTRVMRLVKQCHRPIIWWLMHVNTTHLWWNWGWFTKPKWFDAWDWWFKNHVSKTKMWCGFMQGIGRKHVGTMLMPRQNTMCWQRLLFTLHLTWWAKIMPYSTTQSILLPTITMIDRFTITTTTIIYF